MLRYKKAVTVESRCAITTDVRPAMRGFNGLLDVAHGLGAEGAGGLVEDDGIGDSIEVR